MSISVARADQARIDFLQGLREYNTTQLYPAVTREYQRLAEQAAQAGNPPSTAADARKLVGDHPAYRFNRFVAYNTQVRTWDVMLDAVAPFEQSLITTLNTPVPSPKGSLRLDPDLKLPVYYDGFEFHLTPGSYYGLEIMPFVNEKAWDEILRPHKAEPDPVIFRRFAENCGKIQPELGDGEGKRIVDLGCGIGRTTIPFAELFPKAEVHGIDLAAPLLKYAHQRTEALGLPVHYSQRNAEATGWPDEHFDLVVAYTLFHEIPPAYIRNVIREVLRILKPGGHFVHADVIPYFKRSPFDQLIAETTVDAVGEPHYIGATKLNLVEELERGGFSKAWDFAYNANRFPWITAGRK